MFKRLSLIGFIVVSLFIFTACGSSSDTSGSTGGSGDTITLKLATASPDTSSFTVLSVKPFMEKVTELTDGQVQFDFYPAGQLGAAPDLLSLTRDGVTDIAYFAPTYFPSEMKLSAYALGIPGLFESSYVGTMAYNALLANEEAPLLEKDFLNNGVRPLYGIMLPTYEIYTKDKEVKVPADLKGLRTRASGGITSDALEFAGANTVSMDVADMYGAFDRGVLDALHNYANAIHAYGVQELMEYGTRGLQFGSVPVGLMINENVWQGFSEEIQDAFIQASQEVIVDASKGHDVEEKEFEEQFIEQGIKIYELSDAEKAEWQEVYEEFADQYFSKQSDDDLLTVYEMFQAEVEQVEAEE